MRPTTAMLETIEAEYLYAYLSQAPSGVREHLGMTETRIGGGVAVAMRNNPVSIFSKALGFTEPVGGGLVDQVVDFYRAHRTPTAMIQVAPSAMPADWEAICASHQREPAGSQIKLAAPVAQLRCHTESRLRVEPVSAGDAQEWGTVVMEGFGIQSVSLVRFLSATVGQPGLTPSAFGTVTTWSPEPISSYTVGSPP